MILGCSAKETNNKYLSINPSDELEILADRYYERYGYFFPEHLYFYDVPVEHHNRLNPNRITDIKKWELFEDSIYNILQNISIDQFSKNSDRITFWILKEKLEASIGLRGCKLPLWWNLNHMDSWQLSYPYLLEIQPVTSKLEQDEAIERWASFPNFLNNEINNLKQGLSEGYTMHQEIVKIVIQQIEQLVPKNLENSPFMSPGIRSTDSSFKSKWKEMVKTDIYPSILDYSNFLQKEYLPFARTNPSIASLPCGNEGYEAFIRYFTTLDYTIDEFKKTSQKILDESESQAKELGETVFGVSNLLQIKDSLTGTSFKKFSSEKELINSVNILMENAQNAISNYFLTPVKKDVIVKLSPSYGIARYQSSPGDTAYFLFNIKEGLNSDYSTIQRIVFHETIPGHHLQVDLQQQAGQLHLISQITWFECFGEGWARYCEELAYEMDLYESVIPLLELKCDQGLSFAVDIGVHTKKWNISDAVDFLISKGGTKDQAEFMYYRSIVMPSSGTTYDVGYYEIKKLRLLAEKELQESFNIKEFHQEILESGTLPLIVLRSKIDNWIKEKRTTTKAKLH